MGWDLEPLAAALARHVIVDPNEVVLDLVEQSTVASIGARRNLGLLGAAHPANGVIVRAAAARTLKPGRPLLGFLDEELPFVHTGSVHEVSALCPSGVPGHDWCVPGDTKH